MRTLTSLPQFNRDARLRLIPRGGIILFGTTTAPDGFLKCDGTTYSQVSYYKLYLVIGTAFGGSNGTFQVPNISAPLAGTAYCIKY
jgi:microcystin-dependent protein